MPIQKSPNSNTQIPFGVDLLPKTQQEVLSNFKGTRHKYISENGKFIYHVAIIDYL